MIDETRATWQHVFGKLSSGRFIATCFACWIWCNLAHRSLISTEFTAGMLVLIFEWYFKRSDRRKDE